MTRNSAYLRSFRLVCEPEYAPLVEALLSAQGFVFEEEPFFPLARRLIHEPVSLGASIAALFGYIYIQDRSSMLPPLALAPGKGDAVLDMCASPGSKTGLLGQFTGPSGFVLGNEPSRNRLATLRRNLSQLNLFACCTCSHSGEKIPLLPETWGLIQLDPPCSGWGTVEKNPQVMRLWQGDKVMPLVTLQRRLLAKAAELLAPGGRMAYSTCTTNIEENEHQLRYARDELGLSFTPLEPPKGFRFAKVKEPEFEGALRVDTGEDGQGFFVALLEKPAGGRAPGQGLKERKDPPAPAPENTAVYMQGIRPDIWPDTRPEHLRQGFFVRPWEKESRYVGERKRHGKAARGNRPAEQGRRLPLSVLEEGFADPSLLPAGDIAVFNEVAHFLPAPASALIPEHFAWKGFPLGRIGKQGELRLDPRLRALMPALETARQKNFPVLDLEDIAPLRPLLQGQGLPLLQPVAEREIGLYYRGLPLCRLGVRGRRAVLPAL